MMRIENVSRRGFLRGVVGAGSLVLGLQMVPGAVRAAVLGPRDDGLPFQPDVFLAIDGEGTVTIVAHRSEMGTGIRTSLPMVVADELEADWSRVVIRQAPGSDRYGSQNTDGSKSIRSFFDRMRGAGATARLMLETAAAQRWGVSVAECAAGQHRVTHGATGRSLGFGELAADAAKLPLPDRSELTLKDPSAWKLIGKGVPMTDLEDIVVGRAPYGLDVRLPGMRFATIERSPVLGGRALSFEAGPALAVPGVEQVFELPAASAPYGFSALGGVAVIAASTAAALAGRRKLTVRWEPGGNAAYDTDAFADQLVATVNRRGRVVRERGDVDEALAAAAKRVQADYVLPHLAHASMEPPCALAHVTEAGCEVWTPTQNPQAARDAVARALDLSPDEVTVHVTLLGGGFGRKSKPDVVVEAALLSERMGAPVQVIWTREDDIRHDYYHANAALHLEAGLDRDGHPVAWLQRTAFPPIGSTFQAGLTRPSAGELSLGFLDVPFDVPALRCEAGEAPAHVRIGWLRSVCNVFHAFAIASFADELAVAAGRDRLAFLLELIGPARQLDPAAEGADYGNYGEPLERYPLDTGRLARVLTVAAEQAGWGRERPAGTGLGLAVHRSFLAYVAVAAEVTVSRDGRLTIPRVDVAVDCGLAVDPDRVRAQMEGGAVFGASLALHGEITVRDGAVVQSNFHDYPIARQATTPQRIEVHLVPGEGPPTGIGEVAVPPFAPALCNAVFAATGKRVRRLPLDRHDLSWS